jgi:hypothetical protein
MTKRKKKRSRPRCRARYLRHPEKKRGDRIHFRTRNKQRKRQPEKPHYPLPHPAHPSHQAAGHRAGPDARLHRAKKEEWDRSRSAGRGRPNSAGASQVFALMTRVTQSMSAQRRTSPARGPARPSLLIRVRETARSRSQTRLRACEGGKRKERTQWKSLVLRLHLEQDGRGRA